MVSGFILASEWRSQLQNRNVSQKEKLGVFVLVCDSLAPVSSLLVAALVAAKLSCFLHHSNSLIPIDGGISDTVRG